MTSEWPKAAVVGWPAKHSLSPLIMKTWLDETGQPGIFLRIAETCGIRNIRCQLRLGLFRQSRKHRCHEDPRCDRHDPNAGGRQIAGHRQGHANNAALGGCIGRLTLLPVKRGNRGGVDDHTTRAVWFGDVFTHDFGGKAGHVKRADKIDVDGLLKLSQRMRPVAAQRLDRQRDAGTVDGGGDLAHRGLGAGHCIGHAGLVGHIGFNEMPPDIGGNLCAPAGIAIQNGNFGPAGRKGTGSGFAKTRGGPGDDSGSGVDFHGVHPMLARELNIRSNSASPPCLSSHCARRSHRAQFWGLS